MGKWNIGTYNLAMANYMIKMYLNYINQIIIMNALYVQIISVIYLHRFVNHAIINVKLVMARVIQTVYLVQILHNFMIL